MVDITLFSLHKDGKCDVDCIYCKHEDERDIEIEFEKIRILHGKLADAFERS